MAKNNKNVKKPDDIEQVTNMLFSSLAIVLHDKHGWGKVRIMRLLNQITDQFDSIEKGFITIDDLKQSIRDEVGIDIK